MLVLFETPAGYAIFKLLNEKILNAADNIYESFESPEKASKVVKLKAFKKFKDTTEALAATTAAVEGKMGKTLKKVLKKLVSEETQEKLLVADAKLGNAIKEKLEIPCMSNTAVQELMRCIRGQTEALITGLPQKDLSAMALGLAHSLSRYKLKFSPDKVDTMIVQAISLLDDLDKELNNYIMRCREWYGWHFPELGKVVQDNLAYAKVVRVIGDRTNTANADLSSILPEELEQEVKEVAEISMGTEVSENDIQNILYLCEQVVEITEYRAQLYDYLKNRMMAVAPNLTILVGELVGARLIAHAGSLMNLAKHPSSTVQILGAEKALFRALKTKHDTPKYGLIYHASLVGQSNPKYKGKVSRMLAAKAALAIRVDALGEENNTELGIEHKAKLEIRLREMETGFSRKLSGTGKAKAKWDKYENKSEVKTYNVANDSTLPTVAKKRSFEEDSEEEVPPARPAKKIKQEDEEDSLPSAKKVKKEKKRKSEGGETPSKVKSEPEEETSPTSEKKKKKKKKEKDADVSQESIADVEDTPSSEKKKKKKKKVKQEPESD